MPAFVLATPVRTAPPASRPERCRVPVRCASDEPERSDDRKYRAKIRRRLAGRLERLREAAEAAREAAMTDRLDSDELDPDRDDALLGSSLSEVEPERPGDTVESIGGAWLDVGLAGRGAGQPELASAAGAAASAESRGPSAHAAASDVQAQESAMNSFVAGVELFQRGRYSDSYEAFEDAVRVVGEGSRLGGQVGLWRAQALYAMDARNARKDAAKLLDSLEMHADGEVRKAASELKLILTAPVLPLDPGTFVEIPDFDTPQYSGPRFILAANGVGRMVTKRLSKPEKYSLEWYLEKERPVVSGSSDNSSDWLGLAMVVVAVGTFLAAGLHGGG